MGPNPYAPPAPAASPAKGRASSLARRARWVVAMLVAHAVVPNVVAFAVVATAMGDPRTLVARTERWQPVVIGAGLAATAALGIAAWRLADGLRARAAVALRAATVAQVAFAACRFVASLAMPGPQTLTISGVQEIVECAFFAAVVRVALARRRGSEAVARRGRETFVVIAARAALWGGWSALPAERGQPGAASLVYALWAFATFASLVMVAITLLRFARDQPAPSSVSQ